MRPPSDICKQAKARIAWPCAGKRYVISNCQFRWSEPRPLGAGPWGQRVTFLQIVLVVVPGRSKLKFLEVASGRIEVKDIPNYDLFDTYNPVVRFSSDGRAMAANARDAVSMWRISVVGVGKLNSRRYFEINSSLRASLIPHLGEADISESNFCAHH